MPTPSQRPEQEAAATFARECADHAAVIHWCADRVRWVDGSQAVQDAADYLYALSTRAQVDTTPVTDRTAIIRWCAQEIRRWCAQEIDSTGGGYAVERAAEYLDDLATEGEGSDPVAADPSHNAAHDFPLAERLVNDLIKNWLNTQLGIELAGYGKATPEERAAHKAVDQARHLALSNYRYALTPKILDELRRAGLLTTQAESERP